jgi:hypothetical protein
MRFLTTAVVFFGITPLLFSQSISSSTRITNDSIEISYTINGKKGLIKEPHKIPVHLYRLPEAPKKKQAKQPTDTIRLSSLNYRLLDSLVWVECNVYRKSKNLKPVKWNDTIYKAASHHSEYQSYFNILAHGEPDSVPKREKEQLHYRTMKPFCAEICLARSFIDGAETYDAIAKTIIDQWKHSPGHNKIMIDPKYKMNAFGCSVSLMLDSIVTKSNMMIYNPALLKKIEAVMPDYFKPGKFKKEFRVQLHSTGNFTDYTNMNAQMEWVRTATKTVNPDGTTTYTHSSGKTPIKMKVEEKKKKKKRK